MFARRSTIAARCRSTFGRAELLPFANGSVDKILAVNVAYFWCKPAAVLRVLRPGGGVSIYVTDASAMRRWPFADLATHRLFDRAALERVLRHSDFRRDTAAITDSPDHPAHRRAHCHHNDEASERSPNRQQTAGPEPRWVRLIGGATPAPRAGRSLRCARTYGRHPELSMHPAVRGRGDRGKPWAAFLIRINAQSMTDRPLIGNACPRRPAARALPTP